jgi:hypothetical protein
MKDFSKIIINLFSFIQMRIIVWEDLDFMIRFKIIEMKREN